MIKIGNLYKNTYLPNQNDDIVIILDKQNYYLSYISSKARKIYYCNSMRQ